MSKHLELLKVVCDELEINCTPICDNKVLLLIKDGIRHTLYGSTFDRNTDSLCCLCQDKVSLFQTLRYFNIQAVPHYRGYSSWYDLPDHMKQSGVVIKTNESLFNVRDSAEFSNSLNHMNCAKDDIIISPWLNISNVYRIIVNNNNTVMSYVKERPYVIGDGEHNVAVLMSMANIDTSFIDIPYDTYMTTPSVGSKVEVNWRYDERKGTRIKFLQRKDLPAGVQVLALDAAIALKLKTVSVDIAQVEDEYYIVDVDCDLDLGVVAEQDDDAYAKVYAVYKEVLKDMFTVQK